MADNIDVDVQMTGTERAHGDVLEAAVDEGLATLRSRHFLLGNIEAIAFWRSQIIFGGGWGKV